MISLTECKKTLNKNGIHYSDKEIELIRNVLYKLAEVAVETLKDPKVRERIEADYRTKANPMNNE